MKNQIYIRQAQESDTETVTSILLEARDWLTCKGIPMWDTSVTEEVLSDVCSGLFWLAVEDKDSVGCVRFQTEDRIFWPDVPSDESTFIHRLAVRRKAAGGVASRALIQWAKARTVLLERRFLRLDCDAKRTKLCKIYEMAGFRKHSERQVGQFFVTRFECDLWMNN